MNFLLAISLFISVTDQNSVQCPSEAVHDFYACLIEIDHKADESRVELAVRFFTDDLEAALSMDRRYPYYLDNTPETKLANDLYAFLGVHLILEIGDEVKWNYLGSELEDNEFWVYLEADHSSTGDVYVFCDLLTEMFPAQSNYITFRSGLLTKKWIFNRVNAEGRIYAE